MRYNTLVLKLSLCAIVGFFAGCELQDTDPAITDDQIAQAQQAAEQAAARESSSSSSSSSTSSSSSSTSTGGFLWKPVSEGDGKLVILLPSGLRGKVNGCTISGSFGSEAGNFAGDTHNGNRPHYRFSKRGGDYGSGITVQASLTDGGTQSWSIPNGSQRTEY